jgi:hypothetical protein
MLDMHTAPELQGPCPFSRPHSLSVVSQTPDAQMRAATVGEHDPAEEGRAVPFAAFETQAPLPPVPRLHHCVVEQSVSLWHAVPQEPLAESHTGPAWAPLQSLLVEHLPQAPVEAQKGAVGLGHAPAAVVPLSPPQLAHVSVAVLQTGVVLRHALPLDAVHCTH